jgi:hypothetical protein
MLVDLNLAIVRDLAGSGRVENVAPRSTAQQIFLHNLIVFAADAMANKVKPYT